MCEVRLIQERHGIVGRERELRVALAVLTAGRHLLLEGPVGVGKTRLARALCDHLGRTVVRVDGDVRFSEGRLAGWFDPPLVLRRGYVEDAFVDGPLVRALRAGGVLFVNELDRLPDTAQNVLLPVLDEGVLHVPQLGAVRAAPGFRVVATQNAAEDVAAGELCGALRDRFEHLVLGYQDEEDEVAIARALTACADEGLVRAAVRLTRATRLHPDLASGASVRAAAAMVAVAAGLAGGGRERLRRAASAALPTRVALDEAAGRHVGAVLDELFELVVIRGADPVKLWPPDARRHAGGRAGLDAAGGRFGAGRRSVGPDVAGRDGEAQVAPRRDAAAPGRGGGDAVRLALADRIGTAPGDLDGWDVAARLSAGGLAGAPGGVRAYAERLAAGAVLRRAQRLVGPLRAGLRTVREPLVDPREGDLCLEATLDNLLAKEWPEADDWIVERRVERRREVVLMVDTSLSMAGEKMALAAVAAAVMALKLHPGDLAVVVFADAARAVARLREEVPPRELVRRMLERPCGGATDVAAALELGLAELQRGRDPRRSAVLVSDGVYTAGPDPRPVAARFGSRPLHVLLTADRVPGQASAGRSGRRTATGGPAAPGTSVDAGRPASADRQQGRCATEGPDGRGPSGPPPCITAGAARRGGYWISPHRVVARDVAHLGGGRVVHVDGFAMLPRRMLDLADHVLR